MTRRELCAMIGAAVIGARHSPNHVAFSKTFIAGFAAFALGVERAEAALPPVDMTKWEPFIENGWRCYRPRVGVKNG